MRILGGVRPLPGILSACSPNVSVVNIDNGFGAACIASLINHLGTRRFGSWPAKWRDLSAL
jgi:NCAIR mutase (PurE)-related protein